MKKLLNSIALASLLACFIGLNQAAAEPITSAPIKIGVVDVGQLFAASPKAKAIGERLKKEFQTRENNLIATDKAIKEKEAKLERNKSVMSEAERSKLEKEIYSSRRDLARLSTEFQEDTNIRKREETEKFFKELRAIIKDIAKTNKYNLIVSSETVPYWDEQVNVTDKVLKKLNEKS